MFRFWLAVVALIALLDSSKSAEFPAAEIATIKDCGEQGDTRRCEGRDAIFFVHGIFGDQTTFTNGSYKWPNELSADFPDVDVFVIKYRTHLLNWLKSDVATFDEISEVLMGALQGPIRAGLRDPNGGMLAKRKYRSIGFIAHSLGGNIAAAYIHSVKSELGHVLRAQNAFLITLGTPADGAYIANVGQIIKRALGLNDPLLTALQRDNLFLRMLAMWRRAENTKAQNFQCRPVNLYVGIEGAAAFGIPVVSEDSAKKPYEHLAQEIKSFPAYDHLRIAAPESKTDPLNVWVTGIIKKERTRMDNWGTATLCSGNY
jgi:hypothetical protein